MTPQRRDYAYEALSEVTASDPEVARGALNAALRDIRIQEPLLASVENSYLLADVVHERAKMYRQVFPDIALTPTALSKHWERVKAESGKVKGQNLSAGVTKSLPQSNRERNLEEARKILAKFK